MNKTQQLQIRVSADQKAQIKARAELVGEDVSKWVLRQLLPPVQDEFQRLSRALASRRTDRSHALAELHDFLGRLSAKTLAQAVQDSPMGTLELFEANYVAAMVEYTCIAKGAELPEWIRDVEPLPTPWFASALQSLRVYLLTHSPPAFRRRNLFVDSTVGDRV
jgi:hypothetical protein